MGVTLGLESSPKFGGSPLIFLQTAAGSDFKFGLQLWFAKAHHKITSKKVDVALGLETTPKFGDSP